MVGECQCVRGGSLTFTFERTCSIAVTQARALLKSESMSTLKQMRLTLSRRSDTCLLFDQRSSSTSIVSFHRVMF
jgi:hypothetical protein